ASNRRTAMVVSPAPPPGPLFELAAAAGRAVARRRAEVVGSACVVPSSAGFVAVPGLRTRRAGALFAGRRTPVTPSSIPRHAGVRRAGGLPGAPDRRHVDSHSGS